MGRIQNFITGILKDGLSYNNEYTFGFSGDGAVLGYLRGVGFSNFSPSDVVIGAFAKNAGAKMKILCEEITLPGVSSATGQARGIHQGVDFKYPHTKIYNDLSITFMCDREYTPLLFFEKWFHFVYNNGNSDTFSKNISYTNMLYYDCCMNMTITKVEDKTGINADGKTSKVSAEYNLINVFPASISSIPLNTGASQIVRFTVNLSYERWSVSIFDPDTGSRKGNPSP